MKYLSRPRIRPDTVEERRYQVAMAAGCLERDTLIILPTGLGKTVVALMVAADVISKGRKVLLLAPTKPLVDQHRITFSGWLTPDVRISSVNGNTPPERRAAEARGCDMLIATPQAVANDLDGGLYDLDGFGLVIYDEAHRGVGGYAYVEVAKHNSKAISMGMTASPGSSHDRIMEVCRNLCFTRIDMRTDDDPDVSPYVFDTKVDRVEVTLPPDLRSISDSLTALQAEYAKELVSMGLMDPYRPPTMSHLLQVGAALQTRVRGDEKSSYIYRGLVAQSIAVKLGHAIGLVQTQGMTAFRTYADRLSEEAAGEAGSRSSRELVERPEFRAARRIAAGSRTEHPKLSRAMSLVSMALTDDPGSKVMVFAQYRDTCDLIAAKLSGIPGAKVKKLVGQSKGGLRQKEQVEMLSRFRSGETNVLVCTSVGEEGLDVSSTDLVVFYEPVPSEIRTIQRRGRTGRRSDGRVVVLVARDTIDEAFESTSAKKEERMLARLPKLNSELERTVSRPAPRGQRRLGDY